MSWSDMDDFAVANLSRRGFLKGMAAGSVLVIAASWGWREAFAAERKYGADGMDNGWVDDPKVFLALGADGLVTFVCSRSEMGQGCAPAWRWWSPTSWRPTGR